MPDTRPPPDTLRSFTEWLHMGRYVTKGSLPTAYRLTDFEPLYRERQTSPLPAAPPPQPAQRAADV